MLNNITPIDLQKLHESLDSLIWDFFGILRQLQI